MKTTILTDIHIGFNAKKLSKFKKFIQRMVSFNVECLIISGDISCNKPKQIEQAFRVIREVTKEMKVLVVFGNHDYWDADRDFKNILQLMDYRDQICKEYDIQYLHTNHFENDYVQVFGYDGWYTVPDPGSNDVMMMPGNNMANFHILRTREEEAVEYILKRLNKDKITIVATHFNPIADDRKWQLMSGNSNMFFRLLDQNINLFIYGHTHNPEDGVFDKTGTRILNVGADYNHTPNKNNSYHLTLDLKTMERSNELSEIQM